MPVRILDLAFGQKAEHRPQRVGDGSGLREVGVGQKHADATYLTRHGIVGNLLEFGGCRGVAEDGWFKSFLGGRSDEVVGGENHEIPFGPLNVFSAGLSAA